jgi:hypothetical protein
MANYPTADPSFTTKQDGTDYPQAAHINGVQDEIIAIGAALRGTLQHAVTVGTGGLTVSSGGATISTGSVNIGGPSSLATLQVNAGSTFAGPATFSSAATFNGVVTFNAATSFVNQAPPPVMLVSASTSQMANDSTTAIAWPTQVSFTNSSLHSTATNPERFTPDSTGVWELSASMKLNGVLSNGSTMSFTGWVEDSSGAQVDYSVVGAAGSEAPTLRLTGTKYFNSVTGSTQWMRIVCRHKSASTRSIDGTLAYARFRRL